MATVAQTLEAAALALPEKDRAELAQSLLRSLDATAGEGSDLEWAQEAKRRYEELQDGSVEGIASDLVFTAARARLG